MINNNKFDSVPKQKKLLALFIVLAFVAVGTFIVLSSFAATPTATNPVKNNKDYVLQLTNQLATLNVRLGKNQDAAQINQFSEIAAQRKDKIIKMLENGEYADATSELNTKAFKNAPDSAKSNLESPITDVKGILRVDHGDNFALKKGYDYYYIVDAKGGRQRLFTPSPIDTKLLNRAVSVKNSVKLGNHLLADNSQLTTESTAVNTLTVPTGNKKVVVIPINFEGDITNNNFDNTQLKDLVYGSSNSVNSFYIESSFGKVGIQGIKDQSGDVLDAVTIQADKSSCDKYDWAEKADSALATSTDLSQYNSKVYVFSTVLECGDFSGLGEIRHYNDLGSRVWINILNPLSDPGTMRQYNAVFIHELGHNSGLRHANSYSCTEGVVKVAYNPTFCFSTEYGDPFDVMGYAYDLRQFNNAHKLQQGFFDSSNVLDVTSSGTFSLTAQEFNTKNTQVIRIPATRDAQGNITKYFYLEYRQPSGTYDNFVPTDPVVNGITIRSFKGSVEFSPTNLLDMNPNSVGYEDSPLQFGQSFTDGSQNLTITAVGARDGVATVKVEYSNAPIKCIRIQPFTSINAPEFAVVKGEPLQYWISVFNLDYPACGPQKFDIDVTVPPGFSKEINLLNAGGLGPTTSIDTLGPGPVRALGPTTSKSCIATSRGTEAELRPGDVCTWVVNVASSPNSLGGAYPFNAYIKRTNNQDPKNTVKLDLYYYLLLDVDNSPVVSIASPIAGQEINNQKPVRISANATGLNRITSMTILLDGKVVYSSNKSSINYYLSPTKLTAGFHSIEVRAKDATGLVGSNSTYIYKN